MQKPIKIMSKQRFLSCQIERNKRKKNSFIFIILIYLNIYIVIILFFILYHIFFLISCLYNHVQDCRNTTSCFFFLYSSKESIRRVIKHYCRYPFCPGFYSFISFINLIVFRFFIIIICYCHFYFYCDVFINFSICFQTLSL